MLTLNQVEEVLNIFQKEVKVKEAFNQQSNRLMILIKTINIIKTLIIK